MGSIEAYVLLHNDTAVYICKSRERALRRLLRLVCAHDPACVAHVSTTGRYANLRVESCVASWSHDLPPKKRMAQFQSRCA